MQAIFKYMISMICGHKQQCAYCTEITDFIEKKTAKLLSGRHVAYIQICIYTQRDDGQAVKAAALKRGERPVDGAISSE